MHRTGRFNVFPPEDWSETNSGKSSVKDGDQRNSWGKKKRFSKTEDGIPQKEKLRGRHAEKNGVSLRVIRK